MQQHNLTVGGQTVALSPSDIVAGATIQAKLLMDIVEKTKCFQLISGKKYLQVEAWETIGAFNRVHASTESITPIIRDGETVGYDAKVNLITGDGIIYGSAIMPCYFTENACKGKEGDAKDKACKSAAQTFATSKAYRMNYSYIAILAGYEPLPAEEMTGMDTTSPTHTRHYCETHGVLFFKKGKMKQFAHPIEGTDKWCNEQAIPKDTEEIIEGTATVKDTPPPKTTPEDKEAERLALRATIKNVGNFLKVCSERYNGMLPATAYLLLGVKSGAEIADAQEAFDKVWAAKEPKES